MFVKTFGSAVYGVEAITITIEVNWNAQGKDYCIVGLPDNAIKESMQRVESAIKSIGYEMPRTRIVVNLAPADMKKSGTAFDLPIAIGVLTASEQIKITKSISDHIMMGELSLDGELRAIRGALPISIQAKREGFKGLIIPHMNAREAAMVEEVNVFGMRTLKEVVAFIKQEGNNFSPLKIDIQQEFYAAQQKFESDFSEVKGQENIKLHWRSRRRADIMLFSSVRPAPGKPCWPKDFHQFFLRFLLKNHLKAQRSIVLRVNYRNTAV